MTAPVQQCQPGIAIDPADLWGRYLAEVRSNGGEPSPQGAMAFASEYYYDTASELTRKISNVAEREAAALKSRVEELTGLARFLLERLQEFDPGDFDAERDFHGHVAPAIARLASAISLEDRFRSG